MRYSYASMPNHTPFHIVQATDMCNIEDNCTKHVYAIMSLSSPIQACSDGYLVVSDALLVSWPKLAGGDLGPSTPERDRLG